MKCYDFFNMNTKLPLTGISVSGLTLLFTASDMDSACEASLIVSTVPPETMEPFAAILPRSNCGFDLQFHLGKTASDRIKNLGYFWLT